MNFIRKVMIIAGSDSGAGAGIQADLKTCSALGVYATTVVTALTAQNTLGVKSIYQVSPSFVREQIDAVLEDIGTDAVKTGMLDSREVVEAVVASLKKWNIKKIVVDPVMIAKSGDPLLRDEAVASIVENLFPLAYVVTPNIPEAERIAGISIGSIEDMKKGALLLKDLGPRYVVIKGGHLEGEMLSDVLYDGKQFNIFKGRRIQSRNTHGTGCTFASAIASFIAEPTTTVEEAVRKAKKYVEEGIKHSFMISSRNGHSPLNHFYKIKEWDR